MLHPRHGCQKTYEVKIKGELESHQLKRLRQGLVVDGRRTAPAKVTAFEAHRGQRDLKKNSWWRVVLSQGRSRQIREMFFRVGHPVQRLRRIAIGSLQDPSLRPGEWRLLEEREVEALRKARPRRQARSGGSQSGGESKARQRGRRRGRGRGGEPARR